MNKTYNHRLIGNAKNLRKNMTPEEKHLWYDFLKECPFTVNRQKVIGSYIADFYCASAKLVIEVDGAQHYEAEGEKADFIRDTYLRSHGMRVIRYTNREIKENFEGVCQDIMRRISAYSKGQSIEDDET